jgi:hypothetical protein
MEEVEIENNWDSPILLEWLWRLHRISVEFHYRVYQTCDCCGRRNVIRLAGTLGIISKTRMQVTQLIICGKKEGRSPITIEWLSKLETQLRQGIKKAISILVQSL